MGHFATHDFAYSTQLIFKNMLHKQTALQKCFVQLLGYSLLECGDFYSLPPPYNHDLCCIELIDNPMG